MNILPYNLVSVMRIEDENIDPEFEFDCRGQIVCECGCKHFRIFREKYVMTEQDKQRNRKFEEIKEKYKDILSQDGVRLASRFDFDNRKELIGYHKGLEFYHLETVDFPNTPSIPCVVIAKCPDCGSEHIIFDSSKNGYDALTSGVSHSDDYKLRQKRCRNCGDTFEITVKIHSTGRKDLFEEGAGVITEENWTNAFDWITIDLKCATCGKTTKRWLDYETM